MRVMIKFALPVESSNVAIRSGKLEKFMHQIVEDLKPEAAYRFLMFVERRPHRLVCRDRSILRGDEGSVMSRPPSRPEARNRFGCQTAYELGAPVVSSLPEQLPGHEPASASQGYEDERASPGRH